MKELPGLKGKIAAALGCEEVEALNALREVLRFMYLVCVNESGQLTPSHRVDLAWHEFILFTKAYGDCCVLHFGRMIHHFPGGDAESNRAPYAQTIRMYEQCFGDADPRYWPHPRDRSVTSNSDEVTCGGCESF